MLLARAEAARAAGATALIVTLDWSFPGGRDWGSPAIPERLDLKALARLAPAGLARPGYLLDWLRHGGLPDLTVPNMALPGRPAPGFFAAYRDWMTVPPPSWADIAWLRDRWGGPFLVKGVMRPDDARRAVDAGATAVSVSNHGGNNLDGTPASIRALPAVAAAVGDSAEVLLDGGIRRGADVVKAVALGARAVMIGRACLWGLAAARTVRRPQRLRRAARRHRLGAARARPPVGPRSRPRGRDPPRGLRQRAGRAEVSRAGLSRGEPR